MTPDTSGEGTPGMLGSGESNYGEDSSEFGGYRGGSSIISPPTSGNVNFPAGFPNGCVLALRARTLTGVLSDGNSVTTWTDISGHAHDALSDGSGTSVVYRENVIEGTGGVSWPVVEFARGKTLITDAIINPGLGATLYMVARRNSHLSGADYFLEFTNSAGDANDTTAINDTGESGTPSLQNDLRWTLSSGGNLGTPVSDWFLVRLFLDITAINAIFNGTDSPTLTPNGEIDDIVRRVRLGRHLAGYFADVYLFDTILGTADDTFMLKFFADDYGLAISNATTLTIHHNPTGDPVIAYDSTIYYPPGSIVTYGGVTWLKLSTAAAGTTPVEGSDWTALSNGIPDGGTDGQVLTKQSSTDFDADWEDPPTIADTLIVDDGGPVALPISTVTASQFLRRSADGTQIEGGNPSAAGGALPTGGTAGQVLTKLSGTDFDDDWQDLPSRLVLAFRNSSAGSPCVPTRASSASFNVGSPTKMTVRMWINPIATNTNAGLATRSSLASSQGDWALGFFNGSTQRLTFRVNNNGASIQSATTLTNGLWYFVEASYDSSLGSNNLKLFINGTLDVQGNYTTVITNNAVAIQLATYFDGAHGFVGYISEFEFCAGVVRNTSNYTPPSQITPDANTTIHWSMNEYLLNGPTDDSGNGFNGSLSGTVPSPFDTWTRKL